MDYGQLNSATCHTENRSGLYARDNLWEEFRCIETKLVPALGTLFFYPHVIVSEPTDFCQYPYSIYSFRLHGSVGEAT